MVEAVLRGALLGLATCLTFGPVTVAVMRAGFDRRIVAALLCGAGAALVDGVESYLAYLGVAEILHEFPGMIALLYVLAGAVFIVSGVRALRQRSTPRPAVTLALGSRAFAQGVLLTALNPAPLLAWIALAGTLFADLERPTALLASTGVVLGVILWFAVITLLAVRGQSLLGERARVVTRVLDVILLCVGVLLVVRGALRVFRG